MVSFARGAIALFLCAAFAVTMVAAQPKGPKITSKVCKCYMSTRLNWKLTNCIFQVYFEIEHGGKPLGKIVMGLYGKTVPEVC